MGEVGGDHRLWVNLSALGEGNIFAILPQLMKNMLSDDVTNRDDGFLDVVLPSNEAWQTKIYYKLVEKQRMAETTPKDTIMLDPFVRDPNMTKPHWNVAPKQKLASCASTSEHAEHKPTIIRGLVPITWKVSDIAKAGCLLSTPQLPTDFEDELEMRRVYTLIYDVFRYKTILNQALNDISFFQIFPKLVSTAPLVWLLFYDLYHRSFMKRETRLVTQAITLFDSVGLSYAENALWTQKVRLAAAVSRLRIKHNALSLSELLPAHLRDEKVTEQAKNSPVTCWINPVKVKDLQKLCKGLEKHLALKMLYELDKLVKHSYKWDRHCPEVMTFHPSLRPKLARSHYVKDHMLIVQDRSFCLGPASFAKLFSNMKLSGKVIQSHINSPRTTAYLATLLFHNENVSKLMVFSAGNRKSEYESYFKQLGIANIELYEERLIDIPSDADYLEDVAAVYATPPNSYSAVTDPIDLVCSRGGDLSMLEVLTETADTKQARARISAIIEEQKKTLKFAMSRPQIQFVLYETHSELEAENNSMVFRAMREINRIAKLQHAAIQGKITAKEDTQPPDAKEINNNEKTEVKDDKAILSAKILSAVEQNLGCSEKLLEDVNVPDTDIFIVPDLPTLCNCDVCKNCEKEGCYLALLKRKEIVCLDDKYMIHMAESRGLFGSNTSSGSIKSKSARASKKKQDKISEQFQKPRKRLKDDEIERIAAPTHTFLRHTKNTHEVYPCRKVKPGDRSSIYRQWWTQTTRHILALRSSLIKQKLVPPKKIQNADSKTAAESLSHRFFRVDEVVAKNNACARIPVFPKLRLPRSNGLEKVQIPLHVTSVQFPITPFEQFVFT